MTNYEILALLVSLLAVVISAVSLIRLSRVQKQQVRLQEATAKLSERQLEVLEHEEKKKSRARLQAELVNEGGGNYVFCITNVGGTVAANVQLELVDCLDSPLIEGDVKEKLPAPILNAGDRIRLIAAMDFGSPSAYRAKVSWTNPNGEPASEEFYLTL